MRSSLIFFVILFFHTEGIIILSLVKKTLYFFIFLCLKGFFFVNAKYIFLTVSDTILVTMAAPHLKFSTRFFPLKPLTQQSFWLKKFLALGILRDWWFWAPKLHIWALIYVHMTSYFTNLYRKKKLNNSV